MLFGFIVTLQSMALPHQSDAAVVERAKRALAGKRKARWMMLLNAAFFLGCCVYFTFVGIGKIENLEPDQLSKGFMFGLALAVIWTSFGIIGALFLGLALVPFSSDFRTQELLIKYHDRLRSLGQLPDEKNGAREEQPHSCAMKSPESNPTVGKTTTLPWHLRYGRAKFLRRNILILVACFYVGTYAAVATFIFVLNWLGPHLPWLSQPYVPDPPFMTAFDCANFVFAWMTIGGLAVYILGPERQVPVLRPKKKP
jgi:hypothetical protein